ncbi:hypothetical protein D9M68_740460 [compost metagenome]
MPSEANQPLHKNVNNTTYFRYLETIRIEWMRSIGCQPDPQGEGPVIVNAFCTFHKQLEFPGDVIATMFVSDAGRSRFESWCTLTRSDDPEMLYASGGATTVWVNFPQQKSAPIPDHLRVRLQD